jgi:hypothetical protein
MIETRQLVVTKKNTFLPSSMIIRAIRDSAKQSLLGRKVSKGRKPRDDRVDEIGIGREKVIPYGVGIGGRVEYLQNKGEPTSVNGSCMRQYCGDTWFW